MRANVDTEREVINDTVTLLDRILRDTYGLTNLTKSMEVLAEDCDEPGTTYAFTVPGARIWIACGWIRLPDTVGTIGVPMLYAEANLLAMPDDWAVILDILERRFLTAGGSTLAILNEGESLGLDLLLPLMNYTRNEVETKFADFLKSIEPTQAEIFSRYPDLRPVAVGTRRT